MLPRFFSRRSGISSAEVPDVFTFRRGFSWVLSEENLNRRLDAAQTLGHFQALLDLIELGSWSEGRRGNTKDQRRLSELGAQIRSSVLLPPHRSFSDPHTIDSSQSLARGTCCTLDSLG